jgi:mono/diheme cytochrome c family protein
MHFWHTLSMVFFLFLAAPLPAAEPVPADHAEKMARGQDLFRKQLRPLLLERCLKCHGGEKVRSGFDLTSRETMLKGGENGIVVVPGKSKESRLWKLVSHLDDPHMPPKDGKLSAAEINSLAAWIDLGAPYDKPLIDKTVAAKKPLVVTDEDRRFWSFQPLRRPAVPAVKNERWARNPLDRFVLAKLEEKGLTPNPVAEKRKLIRRVYFDLIGLPPTPEEVEAFIKDDSPRAYEKVLDRLLASPHHGERWARHWLDIVRFAESHGFEHDYDRPTAYHYRDFVIKALNLDLPYDTFVKWQLAGDEFAPDDPLALTATGFLGAGVHSTQITINLVEKERYDELDDIVRTMGTSMLGLTIGCARCHDHKYDPIPTRDYYRLLSTFTTTVRTEVELKVDAAGYQQALAKWDAEHARLLEPRTRYEKEQLPQKFDHWMANRKKEKDTAAWGILDLVSHKSRGGATFTKLEDGSYLLGGQNPDHEQLTLVAHTQQKGITSIRLEALSHPSLVRGGPGRASNGNFALSDFQVTAAPLKGGPAAPVKLINARATFEQRGLPVKAAIDGDKNSAWAVDPQFGKNHAAVFDLAAPLGFDGGTVLTFTLEFNNNTGHGIGRPRLAVSTLPAPVALDGEALPVAAQQVLARLDAAPDTKLSPAEREALLAWYRTRDAGWQELNRKVEEHRKTAPQAQKTKALICSEGLPPLRLHTQGADFLNETHFLKRGDPHQKEGVAMQGFPQVLMPAADQEKRWQETPPPGCRTSYRRRSLANWITDVDQGAGRLLARVIVNRLWQHHFGRGLVATPSDFGFQGDRPSHPELLDYLATELIANGWRLKPLHKLIMTSAAYMQGSQFDKEQARLDPANKLYWRQTPHRLEAEVIRDSLLAVSGTLDPKLFGPGTLDPNHKRRSIYFFVKRSQLVPMMVLFDVPDTLQGVEQRTTTTTAPQSLLLMNNRLVRESARAFAARIQSGSGEAVNRAFALALARPPSTQEREDSLQFIQEQEKAYQKENRQDARQLALTDFCQVLLELNEFIYIE